MKKIYLLLVAILVTSLSFGQDLIITGTFDGPLTGGIPKGIELYVINNISDLSIYGVGSANNGDGSDGEEFTFPADAATAGDFIYIASEDIEFTNFFGFAPNYTSGAMSINGDDAIELFMNGGVVDIFGDINVDGTGEPWEYLDGWAYRVDGTGPDGSTFVLANWTFSGINTFDGETTNATSAIPFPVGTYTYTASSDPAITILYPANTTYNPEITAYDVTFNVANFVVASSGGDGYIKYSLDGATSIDYYTTDPITLSGLASGAHTFYMELVDNSGAVLSPEVNDQVAFDIAAYTDVANLAALRAGTEGDYYRVTGEVFGTYAQANRNQKWVQDTTAGMKIDDNDGIITTVYSEGDGVVNLRGKLDSYNQVLQLVPTADPGAPNSTGNVITPEVITLLDLTGTKALADYESELIKVLNVTISDYDDGGAGTADGTFQAGENYPIDDTTATSFLRTDFYDADYVVNNEALPTATIDMVCIVGGYNGDPQITPRSFFDFLGVSQETTINGFSLYPNPVKNGVINITTDGNQSKNIQIYTILGKLVFAQTTSKTSIDISILNSGIYIINVEENNHFATQKLVIE